MDPYKPALKDPLTKFVRWVSDKLGDLALTEEQVNVSVHATPTLQVSCINDVLVQRRTEIFTKSAQAEKASGIEPKTMLYLGSIGSTPAKQGRGYATTLLKQLTEEVRAFLFFVVFCARLTSLLGRFSFTQDLPPLIQHKGQLTVLH